MDDARYVGVDLAWGERNRTGLAVLDHVGRLLESVTVRTDDEIVRFVGQHPTDTLVAAVDAPLVVPNDTGQRPCEAAVGALFGRFGAGAYPANRSRADFAPEPRGARLAARLGWEMDPTVRPAAGRRVCVEVYTHPGMVSLFRLDHVIPYKVKHRRDLLSLKTSYARLLHHIETTCGRVLALPDSPRWRDLRAAAADASRKSDLERIEDEVDAIFCAYLAWLWATNPDQMIVHGDFATGYIVTPAPPPRTTVANRPAARPAPPIAADPDSARRALALAFREAVSR
jgi:predicted RNase H-like nuclease